MNAYVYRGKGMYLGSLVVVAAKSKKTALRLIQEQLQAMNLDSSVNWEEDVEEVSISKPAVICADNGDY